MNAFSGLLLLIVSISFVTDCQAGYEAIDNAISKLESRWAEIRYQSAADDKIRKFDVLAKQSRQLSRQYPKRAEPLIWEAIILCTLAGEKGGLGALDMITQSQALLLTAIELDPKALAGSAQVTLGSLYYLVPGWPISFGDNDAAKTYLQAALKINPEGIDPNYFYGDFLLNQGKYEQAEHYFKKAIAAPERAEQILADSELKQEARLALKRATQKQGSQLSQFSALLKSLFSFQVTESKTD